MAATAHGSALPPPRAGAAALPRAPAAVPHRWQNLAPAVSGARQAAQVAPCSDAPQFAQKCPPPAVPQLGQVAEPVEPGEPVVVGAGVDGDVMTAS